MSGFLGTHCLVRCVRLSGYTVGCVRLSGYTLGSVVCQAFWVHSRECGVSSFLGTQ